jgi:cobalt-zinc-cadmium efflux system membrane fusion protein
MKWTTLALVALVLGACQHAARDKDDEPAEVAGPVAVTCVPARGVAVSDEVTVRGLVRPPPDRDALVAAAVPGRVSEVKVQEGDHAERGQLLAVIEDPALAAGQAEADAAQTSAAAALANAKQAQARALRLFDEGVAPRRDVEDADAKLAAAAAEERAARARQALAAAQRERALVTAPRAGTVVKVMRRAGELVDGTAATAIAEIADLSSLELHADVPGADLVRLAEGQKAEVSLDALPGVVVAAQVVRVAPGVDTATALGGVRLALTAGEPRPKVGLAGTARIAVANRTVVLVPASALRRSIDGADQVVVCAGAKAAVRPVQPGARRGDDVEVRGGVAAGEAVVVDHALGLEDGAALAPNGKP